MQDNPTNDNEHTTTWSPIFGHFNFVLEVDHSLSYIIGIINRGLVRLGKFVDYGHLSLLIGIGRREGRKVQLISSLLSIYGTLCDDEKYLVS